VVKNHYYIYFFLQNKHTFIQQTNHKPYNKHP